MWWVVRGASLLYLVLERAANIPRYNILFLSTSRSAEHHLGSPRFAFRAKALAEDLFSKKGAREFHGAPGLRRRSRPPVARRALEPPSLDLPSQVFRLSAQFFGSWRGLRTLGAWQHWGPVLRSCVGCDAADGARFPGLRTLLRVFLCDVPVVSAWRPGSCLFGFPASLGPRARAHCRLSRDCCSPPQEALKQNYTVKTTVSWARSFLPVDASLGAAIGRLVGPSVGPAGLQGRSEGWRRRLPSNPGMINRCYARRASRSRAAPLKALTEVGVAGARCGRPVCSRVDWVCPTLPDAELREHERPNQSEREPEQPALGLGGAASRANTGQEQERSGAAPDNGQSRRTHAYTRLTQAWSQRPPLGLHMQLQPQTRVWTISRGRW
eukprot:scaffold3430_cov114-Isochrysis_galbana.AAC.2